jgi:hypothetical protein
MAEDADIRQLLLATDDALTGCCGIVQAPAKTAAAAAAAEQQQSTNMQGGMTPRQSC